MINGDDLFNSYAKISYVNSPLGVWIFSKIYFYVFIGLFIYVVLSLFIGIIGDTYERLKVCESTVHLLVTYCSKAGIQAKWLIRPELIPVSVVLSD